MNSINTKFVWPCLAFVLAMGCKESHIALQPEEIWDRVSPSVLRVEAEGLDGSTQLGSGFVCEIEGQKFILSNRHVVLGAKHVRVGASGDELTLAPGYRISPDLDLALIDVPKGLQIKPLQGRANKLRIGEEIFAIGFPLGLNKSISQGLASSETEMLVQFSAPISSGNSGGPLVDYEGNVIGVVTAGSTGNSEQVVQNLNFAIKTSFIPEARLFQDPILRLYDAWCALVDVENKLIENAKDMRLFDVEACLSVKCAPLWAAAFGGSEMNTEQMQQAIAAAEQMFSSEFQSVAERHGSLEAGVEEVVSYLRNKISEFDNVPLLFQGLGADELLQEFARRRDTLMVWDFAPSEIAPLLTVSIEHAKAAYEDKAFQLETLLALSKNHGIGDTNFTVWLSRAEHDPNWIGLRRTIRLPYERLKNCTEEERIRLFVLSMQECQVKDTVGGVSLQATIRKSGGFESIVSSMFEKIALQALEEGDANRAIQCLDEEHAQRRFPSRRTLAFAYACNGDFDEAFARYADAYMKTVLEFDPFSLEQRQPISRDYILRQLEQDGQSYSSYPLALRVNLAKWTVFTAQSPAYAFVKMRGTPTSTVFSSPAFERMSDFEKCWVMDSQLDKAFDEATGLDFSEIERFDAEVEKHPDLKTLYETYVKPI